MPEHTGETALVEALRDWRRNAAALLGVAVTLVSAALLGTNVACYTAALVVFSIWMAWFVLASIEWLKRAEFRTGAGALPAGGRCSVWTKEFDRAEYPAWTLEVVTRFEEGPKSGVRPDDITVGSGGLVEGDETAPNRTSSRSAGHRLLDGLRDPVDGDRRVETADSEQSPLQRRGYDTPGRTQIDTASHVCDRLARPRAVGTRPFGVVADGERTLVSGGTETRDPSSRRGGESA